jgi:hypothetical protein
MAGPTARSAADIERANALVQGGAVARVLRDASRLPAPLDGSRLEARGGAARGP